MNYRHAFHAGNFADVVKHAVLARVVASLRSKQTGFRIIDTHAGSGLTDLTGPEARKSGEWRNGIGRLLAARLDPGISSLLAPYLDAVACFNLPGDLIAYPGSPLLAAHWLRPQDRLIACEIRPEIVDALKCRLAGNKAAKAILIDGWTALRAYVPPKERRGLILVDPPFEAPDEFQRLAAQLTVAHRKWPTGCYMLWYPIKKIRDGTHFVQTISRSGIPNVLRAEVNVAGPDEPGLIGAGLVIVNPPFRLRTELEALLPALTRVLGRSSAAAFRLEWATGEK